MTEFRERVIADLVRNRIIVSELNAAEVLQLFIDFAPRCSQLLDGWHADGTAWSEWDESVRKELAEIHKKAVEVIEREKGKD